MDKNNEYEIMDDTRLLKDKGDFLKGFGMKSFRLVEPESRKSIQERKEKLMESLKVAEKINRNSKRLGNF